MRERIRAVVLTSGGLDSTTCIGHALAEQREVFPLSVKYGQRHAREYLAIKNVVDFFVAKSRHTKTPDVYGVMRDLKTVEIDLRTIGGSALTDESIAVPVNRDESKMTDIPVTYVPARNTILLSIALGYAEVVEADEIWIGANQLDYSGYPDCRKEFLTKFEELANLATKRGVEGNPIVIRAPLLDMTKSEIVKMGMIHGVPYHLTWSCYKGEKLACGVCDSCQLRLKGFKVAGFEDPIQYSSR